MNKQKCLYKKCGNNKQGNCVLTKKLYDECNEVLKND